MEKNILKKIDDEISRQYPTTGRWIEAMKCTPMNNMVRHSFIREYVFKNFDISEFCIKFEEFLVANNSLINDQPLKLYQEFIIRKIVEDKKLLNGKPIEKDKLPEKVCIYLSAYKFYKSIISEGEEARDPGERRNLKKKRIFRLMIENKLTPDDMSNWKGVLGGASGVIWFTKYDSIPPEFSGCSDDPVAAKKIRDLLGLAHMFNDGLIEVQIPKKVIENGSRIPTICEAVGYPYFKPAKRIDGFGQEIDLDKKCPGLPIAVHPKIIWGENFKIRYVGDLPEEITEFSDLEWREVLSKSEIDLIAFIKGLKDEA
ncbi:MAG: hypothetical protein NT166_08005 [Candidatus Aminicenantes bacterium]|nr:hypothetical protein [Candidatus Aminicenantes bacterium]